MTDPSSSLGSGPSGPNPSADLRTVPGLGERAAELLERLLHRVREADRYLKAKVLVVAAWVACSSVGTAVVYAFEGEQYNEIGAEMRFVRHALVGGHTLSFRNVSDEDWDDVLITVDDRYTYRRSRIRAKGRVTIDLQDFVEGDLPEVGPGGMRARRRGRGLARAPEAYMPRAVALECDEGRFRTLLEADAQAGGR